MGCSSGNPAGTHKGHWLGIPVSGAQVEVRYMDIWRAHDGQLVENRVLIDILGFLEQLGYDMGSVLRFVGSKPPSFFEESDPLEREHW